MTLNILWPVPKENRIITTDFGKPTPYENQHMGIDLGMPIGTPLRAPISGRAFIDHTDTSGDILWIIDVTGKTDLAVRMCHLSGYTVTNGQEVHMGDTVALSGMSGDWVTGPHLHLEVWQSNTPYETGPYCNNPEVITLLWRNGKDYNRVDPMIFLDDVEIPKEITIRLNDETVISIPVNDEPTKEPQEENEVAEYPYSIFDTFLPYTAKEELPTSVPMKADSTGMVVATFVMALAMGIRAAIVSLTRKKK